jgi:imidazolonepropionase
MPWPGAGPVPNVIVEFSTRGRYPDARRFLEAGVTVALATDCNPGSSYTTSMPFCVALAVREMGMTPAEGVCAATAGGRAPSNATTSGACPPAPRQLRAPRGPELCTLPIGPVPLVAGVSTGGRRVG